MPEQYIHEDLEKVATQMEVGDKLVTRSKVVGESESEMFVNQVGLTHPVFFSDEFAQGMGLKKRVVSWVWTFAHMIGLVYQTGFIRDALYAATDKARYIKPVHPGDTIKVEVEVLSQKYAFNDTKVFVEWKWTVINQDEEIVAEGVNT